MAALSGDARRALDICRTAAEKAQCKQEGIVTVPLVQQAIDEMFAAPKILAMRLVHNYVLLSIDVVINS